MKSTIWQIMDSDLWKIYVLDVSMTDHRITQLCNLIAKNVSRIMYLLRQVLFLSDQHSFKIFKEFFYFFSSSYDHPNLHSSFIDKYLWKNGNDLNDTSLPCHTDEKILQDQIILYNKLLLFWLWKICKK